MTSPLSVIILAAGKGTRMQSAKPKVLQTLAGKSLLAHVLDTCHQLTVDETIIVYGFGGEQVKAEITTQYAQSALTWVAQTEQLGTGHAVKVTLSDLPKDGQSLILYGDVPLVSCQTLTALKSANTNGMSMLTLTVDNPFGLGRIKRDNNGNIEAIVEQKDASADEQAIKEINSGIYCVDNALLHKYLPKLSNDNAQQEYYLTDIVKMAVADGIAIAAIEPEHTFEIEGVNNRQQLASLERTWQGKLVADLQEAGVQFADPSRVDIRGTLSAGQDVFVDVGVVFEGDCTLGDNVYIEPGCVIKNAHIGNACHIKPYCVIDHAKIGTGVDVGPFAHLRPESVLADQSKVGNFVEIKKSTIGQGSKVNHLSYVGDSTVGTGVNIGAGVITCNYDGVNKSQTIIEDNAFIGSNASLVAPVTIGDTATVAAGSVITKDVDASALAFGRARQTQKENFQRPTKK
ncbi:MULTISPECIES: bifunctional UDP-N-acetylglucosamine diphosphorylase/glucosamine-1-phosphate N-acetyltransferase GlmU [unclassified Psychrobacter]|uniref:bifunctional UDP-N-acetylglucosamine diphosphorylase/glucosamine-1-phosphate N-acetyltransferase GlmU n=1 Tax=unclassified Psychrobacter TaxID=196806 RepID=UPI000946E200|nr:MULTISPECIES: bifunctional UDP-N-acetylglucosamine diphosphorylase/glucosamine-1-phosphate N-acetyltransferase GlmU [unclassified Psychrobacter]OLF39917.1 UDP-N-acetylglucosamine diphosphorylase/glucosamine-1-phosphate N-acetyltransferase [Psychrobacter sp. Rd 27.2]PJX20609.1 UDP-N-acetylglucosamine diphosphorylase/glucosamine-1-phosphate N-acetyltransferase [Psychrobacter sp. L7]